MISKEGFNNSSAKWIKQDSVLIALAGQGKTRGKVAINRIPLTTNQSIAGIEPSNEVYYKFLYHQLTKDYLKLRLVSSGDGSRGGLNKKLLNDYAVNLSSIDEQHKLGILLSRIDNTLQLHERKCEELTLIKKALLQKLFPKKEEVRPEVRYKNFSDAWEQRKLGEVMDVGSVKRIHQSDWKTEGVRFLRARDIVSFSKNEKPSDLLYIDNSKYNEYSKISGKVQKGDLLVTGVGSIGVPMLIKSDDPIYFKDGNIIWFKNNNSLNGNFFYYSFTSNKIQNFIRKSSGAGTVGTYTIDNGKKTPILIPKDIDEQEKVGKFLSRFDALITLHQRKLEKLKQLKKFLLQNMFI